MCLLPFVAKDLLQLTTMNCLDSSFRRHEPELGRRPGEQEIRMRRLAAHREMAATIGLADHHSDLGHQTGRDAKGELLVGLERALLLGLRANHQAWNVVKEKQR